MEDPTELLQRCDKNALVSVVKNLCVKFQEILEWHEDEPEENNSELNSEYLKSIIHKELLEMQVAKKRQQDKDRNAFTVVVGAGVATGKPNFQMVEGGRELNSRRRCVVVHIDVFELGESEAPA